MLAYNLHLALHLWTYVNNLNIHLYVVGWHNRLNGQEFEQTPGIVKDREGWYTAVLGSKTVGHDWVSEQQFLKNLLIKKYCCCLSFVLKSFEFSTQTSHYELFFTAVSYLSLHISSHLKVTVDV